MGKKIENEKKEIANYKLVGPKNINISTDSCIRELRENAYFFHSDGATALKRLIVDSIKRELIKVSCLLHARLNSSQGNMCTGASLLKKLKILCARAHPIRYLSDTLFFLAK